MFTNNTGLIAWPCDEQYIVIRDYSEFSSLHTRKAYVQAVHNLKGLIQVTHMLLNSIPSASDTDQISSYQIKMNTSQKFKICETLPACDYNNKWPGYLASSDTDEHDKSTAEK